MSKAKRKGEKEKRSELDLAREKPTRKGQVCWSNPINSPLINHPEEYKDYKLSQTLFKMYNNTRSSNDKAS